MTKFLLCNLSNLFIALELKSVVSVIDDFGLIPSDFYLSYFAGYYIYHIENELLPVIDLNNLYSIVSHEQKRKMLIMRGNYCVLVDGVDRIVESKPVILKRRKISEGFAYKSYIKIKRMSVPVIDLDEIEFKIKKEKKIEESLIKKRKLLKIDNGFYKNPYLKEEETETADNYMYMVVYKYNGKLYGINTRYGYYITDNTKMVSYPYSDKLVGLINLHGEIINILSAKYVYEDEEFDTEKFVIVESDNIKFGLKAEDILNVYRMDDSKFIKKSRGKFIQFVYKDDMEILIINVNEVSNDLQKK